jgi:hypothetical protein
LGVEITVRNENFQEMFFFKFSLSQSEKENTEMETGRIDSGRLFARGTVSHA